MEFNTDEYITTRTQGIASSGLVDQYSDGKAANVWEIYIGQTGKRTSLYKNFLVNLLREKNCKNVLDVACGTGIDSVMLLENNFAVVSSDASDHMLKRAGDVRWRRRHENYFKDWDIQNMDWLNLKERLVRPAGIEQFDALICMGNSFAHLENDKDQQREAMKNFYHMIKPGGILIVDHRNFDRIIEIGKAPMNNIYYNCEYNIDIKTIIVYYEAEPAMVLLDYNIDIPDKSIDGTFRLRYHPHKLRDFTKLLTDTFGENAPHDIFADFKPLNELQNPTHYIHVIQKL
ncbi:glycine N-methyltransferase [Lepeophtheirus salmonis]|uniref:Glycine N-methyltransferase n=2 Tax=Lepeophtheirus salmonis TaxID=72036 RepID=C1BT05_LEPSM|nr:glycine N-methyltransferase-like [Lepeophtheirus salmonis]ACO12158.1 Glycine N-methyltransferase [Lepeophtheirus salmonis]